MANEDEVEDSDSEHFPPTGEKWKEMSVAILKTINDRFYQFETKLASLQSSQKMLVARMDSVEEVTSDCDFRLMAMEKTIGKLQVENTRLRAKANDLEGRSRCNNIKIVCIPEGEERGKPTFMSALISKLLGETHFQKPVIGD